MTLRWTIKPLLIALTINLLAGLSAFADSSYELTCRNRAKEIAAESYKNCVTENRQTQLQQIRSDYKEKLADLKNHYDSELKKVSGKQASTEVEAAPKNVIGKKQTSKAMRTSGARNLPKKAIRTEVIDLSTPLTESPSSPDESTSQSHNRMNTGSETPQDAEIVELPTQE